MYHLILSDKVEGENVKIKFASQSQSNKRLIGLTGNSKMTPTTPMVNVMSKLEKWGQQRFHSIAFERERDKDF